MGWASAGDIFDPVAQALIDAGASDDIKRRTLSKLIRKLKDGDWDTESESLGQFSDDPAIVDAFRENGVVVACGDEDGPDGADWCELERDHEGDHEDYDGTSWPRAASAEQGSEHTGGSRG